MGSGGGGGGVVWFVLLLLMLMEEECDGRRGGVVKWLREESHVFSWGGGGWSSQLGGQVLSLVFA